MSLPYLTLSKEKKNVGTTTTSELDNDEDTLNKEKTVFGELLAKLSPVIGIVEVEEDHDGKGNTFLLRTPSLMYVEEIKALFKDSIQYEVNTEICRVPQEGGPLKSLRPSQRTVTIYRRALKKLKRPLPLTLFYSSLCMVAIGFCLILFYRIVVV